MDDFSSDRQRSSCEGGIISSSQEDPIFLSSFAAGPFPSFGCLLSGTFTFSTLLLTFRALLAQLTSHVSATCGLSELPDRLLSSQAPRLRGQSIEELLWWAQCSALHYLPQAARKHIEAQPL